jgi:dienelactone hydrolase
MESFCKRVSEQNFDVICPNLLGSEYYFDYTEEEIAYLNFTENVEFNHAVQKIKEILLVVKNIYQKIYIFGFSIPLVNF